MIISLRGFDVRPAMERDIERIVELDRVNFGKDGVEPYTERQVRCWMDINPSGLLVATQNESVVAYRYSQYLDFDLADIGRLTTNNAFTDNGFTRSTHKIDGNSINGVTVASAVPGGGRVLFEAIFRQLRESGRRYYFGFARISGFDAYCRSLESRGIDIKTFGVAAVANWYAMECARGVSGKVWGWVTPQRLPLPSPDRPDPVLSKYLKHDGFGIAAILPNWMKDERSRNVGVMVLFKNPDVP